MEDQESLVILSWYSRVLAPPSTYKFWVTDNFFFLDIWTVLRKSIFYMRKLIERVTTMRRTGTSAGPQELFILYQMPTTIISTISAVRFQKKKIYILQGGSKLGMTFLSYIGVGPLNAYVKWQISILFHFREKSIWSYWNIITNEIATIILLCVVWDRTSCCKCFYDDYHSNGSINMIILMMIEWVSKS